MSSPNDLPHEQNLAFVEALYDRWRHDPLSVPAEWRERLEALFREREPGALQRAGRWRPRPSFRPASVFAGPSGNGARGPVAHARSDLYVLQDKVDQLVRAYRTGGHRVAGVDPLSPARPWPRELTPECFGLTEAEQDLRFSSDSIPGGENRTLREILEHLRNTYCRSIGVEYMHLDDRDARFWLRDRMESTGNRLRLRRSEQVRILTRLTDAVIFEDFVSKKFVGAKSFSLEGAESLIPLLDLAIEAAGEHGLDELVLAMAHRGRLNVLNNILGKTPQEIFSEFSDREPELNIGRGDVKYHLGYSSERRVSSGRKVHLSLCFNPSHLEFVNPVALGRMRAKQDRAGDREGNRGGVILIHGDAAFAGEGIVQETLNLSELEAYSVGGTIHVIVNNQLGFTTTPQEGRSSAYATSVAKLLQVPVFHVNGEDPEAVAQTVRLALDFRMRFHRDVVIDMYCYRRRGHNEGDEPSFTQPLLYRTISERPSVRDGYLERLLELGGVRREDADRIEAERRTRLEAALAQVQESERRPGGPDMLHGIWTGYFGGRDRSVPEVSTGLARERLVELLERMTAVPADFHVHPRLERLLHMRRAMARGERPLDWGTGELLAFASLAVQEHPVRLSGQDSARGTFSQRHAVLHDHEDGHTWEPLRHLSEEQAPVGIYNSPLSEVGVLGFEYGYSLDCPEGLVVWEAQFGDFANAAQVIIDQFLTSAEDKWRRLSGLVLLLPHGFEGMGPEHSSARLERFLTLAAEDNVQIVYPTTPAQHFHCLRRQVLRPWRKPLVVMTPKSLLRHKAATSGLDELAEGRFRRVIPDETVEDPDRIRRILLVSGKVYYDLVQEREERGRDDVAIVRIEQLYPFPEKSLEQALEAYGEDTPVAWVQEEPENMGAWRFVRTRWPGKLFGRHPFSGVSRPESASPATGSASSHRLEQQRLLAEALGDEESTSGGTS